LLEGKKEEEEEEERQRVAGSQDLLSLSQLDAVQTRDRETNRGVEEKNSS
jgi:hypothetical protein